MLKSNIPEGALADKWTKYKSTMRLVAPNNKRNIEVIVVGTGLAGGHRRSHVYVFGTNVIISSTFS